MTAEGSYKNYRTTIQSVQPPCVPYIGVYLLDLTYIEDGNPDNLGNRINFSKRTMVSRVIQQLQQYQENCPPPQTNLNEELIQQLWSIPEASNDYEKLLYAESKKRE